MRGFTVIELMLFLGITGALFVGLMIGVNSSITQQRYKESVNSLVAILQGQYSEVDNTRNDRSDDWSCTGGTVVEDPVAGQKRGTSSCVLLGKAVQIQNDGSVIRVMPVIGVEPGELVSASDIDALQAYLPKLSTYNETVRELDWQTFLTDTESHRSTFSMLVLRSPVSGLLRVFASNDPLPGDLTTMINADNATTERKLCLRGERGALPVFSIIVNPRIGGPDGVMVQEFDVSEEGAGATCN